LFTYFSLFLHLLAFALLSPTILNITIAIITSKKHLIACSTGTIIIPRAMMGRQKKTGKPVSPQQKISTGTRKK
jgi:hypothetical protein